MEPFLTMISIINLSALLVTKKGFMLVIILSNYNDPKHNGFTVHYLGTESGDIARIDRPPQPRRGWTSWSSEISYPSIAGLLMKKTIRKNREANSVNFGGTLKEGGLTAKTISFL